MSYKLQVSQLTYVLNIHKPQTSLDYAFKIDKVADSNIESILLTLCILLLYKHSKQFCIHFE